jgi:serine/threonine protein kinase
MTSLAQAIRTFQSSGTSREEFLALVDRALSHESSREDATTARLIAVLHEEQARTPLPSDMFAAVRKRIEHASLASHGATSDETRMQTFAADFGKGASPGLSPSSASHDFVLPQNDQTKEVGDTLNGRFVLEECLGIGGMGTVYKALDLRKLEASDRRPYIAIKVLNLQFRGNPKSLIALQREAKKAQALGHRNIVTVYDFDRDGPVVYLTMEYLAGQPLSRVLRAPDFKGMDYEHALPIFRGMANALAYAHERGFVHCDFKPANVFLTDTNEIKVIDFGIARVFQRPEEESDATVFDPGSLGAMTPTYASVEMLEHREPDPRDDVYALGCTTYELLTGRHPFDRVPANQARSAGSRPVRPAGLGARQWRALRMALSFDRETRMPSVARFLEEFGVSEQSPARRRSVMAVSAAALAAAAAGVYYYAVTHRDVKTEQAVVKPETTAVQPLSVPTLATISPVLTSVPCAALAATLHGSSLSVQGFVDRAYGVQKLRDTLSRVAGVSNVDVHVQEVDADKCGVLAAVAPNYSVNRTASLQTKDRVTQLTEGQPLVVDIKSPPYETWINIDYFQLDGSVVHLLPNARAKDNQAPPDYTASIGQSGDWIVGKPFGAEMIVLLATPAPLFDTPRPDSESRGDYLRALGARLHELELKFGRDKIAVDLVQIDTHARKH